DAPGVLLPGHSVTIRVMAGKRARVSVVSMLASTNDGFIGLNGARLHGNMSSKMVGVYDAGSEANTEMCAHIPGPPCAMDSGNARMENGAEGFVSFHSGIRGNVDIPAGMDWRGDLALISIKKVSD
ncbi:MAG: spondin domain-containing protein, partial [Gammaproteobacteria bacterium]|nr:spondin domain-containing protein [Gammaproteobacteria bacterium]